MRRARSPEAKEQRRGAILQAAAQLVEEHAFDAVTMARVARAAGIAKGTTYLYFRTKEELFLALLQEEYDAFFEAVREGLAAMPAGSGPGDVAAMLVQHLRGRKRFLILMELLHVVFEHNVADEHGLAFKTRLRDQVLTTGAALAVAASIAPDEAARLLLRMHALVVGLRQMTRPSPALVKVMEREDMESMRIEFHAELTAVLSDLIRAAQVREESA